VAKYNTLILYDYFIALNCQLEFLRFIDLIFPIPDAEETENFVGSSTVWHAAIATPSYICTVMDKSFVPVG